MPISQLVTKPLTLLYNELMTSKGVSSQHHGNDIIVVLPIWSPLSQKLVHPSSLTYLLITHHPLIVLNQVTLRQQIAKMIRKQFNWKSCPSYWSRTKASSLMMTIYKLQKIFQMVRFSSQQIYHLGSHGDRMG